MKKIRMKFLSVLLLVSCALSLIASNNGIATKRQVYAENLYLPEFSSFTPDYQINRMGHVSRLPEYDNMLNMVGYQNIDGTKTVYVYENDIKFIDHNGIIREKDTSIVNNGQKEGYAYSQKSNNIQSFFSGNNKEIKAMLTDGVHSIVLLKENRGGSNISVINSGKGEEANNYIQYDNAFGDKIHLRYTTGVNGFKEDIILEHYYDNNKFSMIVETELIPFSNGRSIVFRNKNNEDIFVVPGVTVYDSNIKDGININLESQLRIVQSGENRYLVTIIVDNAFLEDPNTVFPVNIDPTVVIANPSVSADAVVYSAPDKANIEFGYDTINMVGHSSSNGDGYFYTKFDLSSLNIRYDNVLSAYYHVKELSGKTNTAVVNAYMTTGWWSESTLKWNNKPTDLNKIITSCKVVYNDDVYSNNNWYDFYITQPTMGWLQGMYNYGIVLKLNGNETYRAFASKEYVSYIPSLYITYIEEDEFSPGLGLQSGTVCYIKNKKSKNYLTYSDSQGLNLFTTAFNGSSKQKWVVYLTDSIYWRITPLNNIGLSLTLCGDLSGSTVSLSSTVINDNYQKWKGIRRWNGAYGFQPSLYSSGSSSFTLTEYGNSLIVYPYIMDYDFSQDWTIEPVSPGTAVFYSQVSPVDTQTLTYANNIGFTTSTVVLPYTSFDLLNQMSNPNFLYIGGHGWSSGIQIGETGYSPTYLSAIEPAVPNPSTCYVGNLPTNSLKQNYCLIYDGCRVGASSDATGDNMVGISFKRGSHFTIAWAIKTVGNDFKQDFLQKLDEGESIYEAIIFAVEENTYLHGMWNYHFLGDTDIVFKHVING